MFEFIGIIGFLFDSLYSKFTGFAVLPNNETVPCMDYAMAVYFTKIIWSKFFKWY